MCIRDRDNDLVLSGKTISQHHACIEEGCLLYTSKGFQKGLEQGIEKGIVKGLEKGIEKGIEKGMEKGLEKGKRALLKSQIAHKYGKEDDWIDTLPDHQVEDAILHILECDTYDALKDRLKGKDCLLYTSRCV